MPVRIECNERCQNDIESPGIDFVAVNRFRNSVIIVNQVAICRHFAECHFAALRNYRCKNALFHAPRAQDNRPGVYLVVGWQVASDQQAPAEKRCSNNLLGDSQRCVIPGGVIHLTSGGECFLALGTAWLRINVAIGHLRKVDAEGASRMCRHRPSLSNRSNRWSQPWQQQARRFTRSCSNAADSARPRGKNLGSKGIQASIVHRRRRQFFQSNVARPNLILARYPAADCYPVPILRDRR